MRVTTGGMTCNGLNKSAAAVRGHLSRHKQNLYLVLSGVNCKLKAATKKDSLGLNVNPLSHLQGDCCTDC